MTDLLTGGAGFIGSHLVHRLVETGRDVRVIDDLSTGVRARLHDVEKRIDFITGDLLTADFASVLAGVDRVFHLAAVPSVPRSMRDPFRTHQVATTATLRLLIAARDAGVARLVFSSSSSVYGESAESPKHERLPLEPVSPYGIAKAAAEMYVRAFARLYGLHTVSLRYFNVFGPGQDPRSAYAAVIPIFVTRALADEPLPVFGDGLQTRDFTYVDNVVSANVAAAEATCPPGRAYNIALGEPRSVLDLIASIERHTGRRARVEHHSPRPGDIIHSHADTSAAARELGWKPAVGFDEGIRRTVEWFRRA